MPIGDIAPGRLRELLVLECAECEAALRSDFRQSAQWVHFLAELGALDGFALIDLGGRPAGYACCSATDEPEFILSDFYVEPASRSIDANTTLLRSVLEQLPARIDRVIFAPSIPHLVRTSAIAGLATVYPRAVEAAPVSHICSLRAHTGSDAVAIRPWADEDEQAAAELIPSAYAGHIEAGINGFARSVDAARRFIGGIVRGEAGLPFLRQASLVAARRDTGQLCGVLLATHAMAGVAHADLLCVDRAAASHRLGQRLSRQFALTLQDLGYHTITLQRGTADQRLNRFYGRLGFVTQCEQRVVAWSLT